jgi:hypothetical protein
MSTSTHTPSKHSTEYKDRFTQAEWEQQDKSAFICETCNTRFDKKAARNRNMVCCGQTLKEAIQSSFDA